MKVILALCVLGAWVAIASSAKCDLSDVPNGVRFYAKEECQSDESDLNAVFTYQDGSIMKGETEVITIPKRVKRFMCTCMGDIVSEGGVGHGWEGYLSW